MEFKSSYFKSEGEYYSSAQMHFIGTFSADTNVVPFSSNVGDAIEDTPETIWSVLESLDVSNSDELRPALEELSGRSKLQLLHTFLSNIDSNDKASLLEAFPLKSVLQFAVEDSLSSRHTYIDSKLAKFIHDKSQNNPEEFIEASKAVISDNEVVDLAYERKVERRPSAKNALKSFNQKAHDIAEMTEELNMPDVQKAFGTSGRLEEVSGQNLVDEMVLKVTAKAYEKTNDSFFLGHSEDIAALRATTSQALN